MHRHSSTQRMLVMLLASTACGRLGFEPLPEGDDRVSSNAPNKPVIGDGGGVISVSAAPEDAGADPANMDAGPVPPFDSTDGSASSGSPEADAGTQQPPADAGGNEPSAVDAGAPSPPPARVCQAGGVDYAGLCWYLSGSQESCYAACRGRSGVDARAPSVIGSAAQGGSAQACAEIFNLLGFRFPVLVGTRSDGLALGCNRWDDGSLWWLSAPGFEATSSSLSASRVCACAE